MINNHKFAAAIKFRKIVISTALFLFTPDNHLYLTKIIDVDPLKDSNGQMPPRLIMTKKMNTTTYTITGEGLTKKFGRNNLFRDIALSVATGRSLPLQVGKAGIKVSAGIPVHFSNNREGTSTKSYSQVTLEMESHWCRYDTMSCIIWPNS